MGDMFFPAVGSLPGHRLGLVLVSGDDRSWWQMTSGECTCGMWAVRCCDEDLVFSWFEAHLVQVRLCVYRPAAGMRTRLSDVVECVR